MKKSVLSCISENQNNVEFRFTSFLIIWHNLAGTQIFLSKSLMWKIKVIARKFEVVLLRNTSTRG